MARIAASIASLLLVHAAVAAQWRIDTVDPAGTGNFSSLKIDKLGNVHVAYIIQDGNQYPLRYGFWDRRLDRWFLMNVDRSAGSCALTLDSNDRPRIAYVDYGSGSGSKLRYAYFDGGTSTWKTQPIPLQSDVIAYYTSIVLDSHDNPSISFYEYRGAKETEAKIRMRVVVSNGKYWEVKTVDAQEGSGKFNSMAIDAKGNLHLAYANVASGTAGLRYAYWDGNAWTTQVVDDGALNNGDSVGYSVAIALDKQGDPHIAYMNESTPRVKYAVRKNGKWQVQTVTALAAVGYPDRNSIAIGEDGSPYISYYDAGRGSLQVAHRVGAIWMAETIDSNAAGFTSSLQIYNGQLWVSYADGANAALKVAHTELPGGGAEPTPQAQRPTAAAQAAK